MTPPPLRVLAVVPVPPPVSGKNVMLETFLAGRYRAAEVVHLDATLARSLDDMGSLAPRKLVGLAAIVARALTARVRQRPDVLYYAPAGDDRAGILRDIAILLPLRPWFRTVVFHVHGRGLGAAVAALPGPVRALARRAYRHPAAVLGPSQAIIDEAAWLGAPLERVVPNATTGGAPPPDGRAERDRVRILFLSLVSEAKGASWLVDATAELVDHGLDVGLTLAGDVTPAGYGAELEARIRSLGLAERVELAGLLVGEAKWAAMAAADVFCVPSTYTQESFGLVLVEAASCARPVVAADVPGVREVLRQDESVLLADPADRSSLAPLLERLVRDPELRARLGREARRDFEEHYTLDRHWAAIDAVFAELAG